MDFNEKQNFNISIVDFNTGDTLQERYSDYPDTKQLEEKYKQTINIDDNNENLEYTLENKYNHKTLLNDMTKTNIKLIKNCFRQLKRISLSVQDLRYRLSIFNNKLGKIYYTT